MAGPSPKLLVEDLRGLDLDVASPRQLLADLALDQPQEHRSLGKPEGHPRRLGPQGEQPELGPEASVVAGPRLLQALEVRGELRPGEERGAVDAGEHLPRLVAAPVGPGDRAQLEGLDPPGGRTVRAATQVDEGAVPVQRHRLDPLVGLQVLDQLDLVRLVLGAKPLDRLVGADLGALERLVGLDVGRHPLLDPLQVRLRWTRAVRELEVVVEAVLDRRADRDLGAGHRSSTAVAITWAASWRTSHSASGSPESAVTISIRAPSGSGAARSRSSPSTLTPSASLASRGPIAAAASAPLAPSSSSSSDPSGSFTVIGGHATQPPKEGRSRSPPRL